MARSDNVRPVIIKRKKVVAGGGHHGGAWKVAYADFVTAMMAFFLMLWLLGSVSEDQRKGIADYFSPTLSIQSHSAGSNGMLGGQSISVVESITDRVATQAEFEAEARLLEEVSEALQALAGHSIENELALEHVLIRLTDEGLVVEIFDLPDRPLFTARSADPEPVLRHLVPLIAQSFELVQNEIAIAAHSAAMPSVLRENPVWPMTLARADTLRQMVGAAIEQTGRIQRATGHADRSPVDPNPMAVRNNRLELTLLRSVPRPPAR
jgi:chemotaxis protein MotB